MTKVFSRWSALTGEGGGQLDPSPGDGVGTLKERLTLFLAVLGDFDMTRREWVSVDPPPISPRWVVVTVPCMLMQCLLSQRALMTL